MIYLSSFSLLTFPLSISFLYTASAERAEKTMNNGYRKYTKRWSI